MTNKSSQELRLTWLSPERSYGVITNYTIRINFTSGIGRNTRFSSMTNLPISNLRPHQLVFVMISATNSKGSGPFSTEIRFRTNEASKRSSPQNIFSLKAQWEGVLGEIKKKNYLKIKRNSSLWRALKISSLLDAK